MLERILDIVFPRACPACGSRTGALVCDACLAAFPWIGEACARCGRPVPIAASDCGDCRALRPAFRRARAVARYAGPARDVLMAFKFGGERRAARGMAALMAPLAGEPELVTFVPATRRAVAVRGFNPAEELARALGFPCRPLLRKVRETSDQAGLAREARRRNLRGAFVAEPAAGPVLLIDDVLTTGATADACARALLEAGIAQVGVLTFARAV